MPDFYKSGIFYTLILIFASCSLQQMSAGLVGVAAWIIIGKVWNFSPYFIAFTCLMMLASATAEYLINRIKDEAFRNSLTDAVTRLIRMKKLRLRQTIIGCITLVVVWLPWLAYEFSHHFDGREFYLMFIGGGVGILIGGGIGISILLKMQRTNDAMIRQIEEFTNQASRQQ